MIKEIVKNAIGKAIGFLVEHKRGALLGAAGIGSAAAAAGIINRHGAEKINKRAIDIQEEALALHEKEFQKTQLVLAELGKIENRVANSFPRFADAMERIQNRPDIKTHLFSTVKLPNYQPKEIRKLSADVQMALAGAGGAGVGAMAGLAAFGIGALVAAPAMVGSGLILCIKGIGLKKKAIKNEKQAKELRKDVEQIVSFYEDLRSAADSFRESITNVYGKYCECLQHVERIVDLKTRWKDYSKKEKTVVTNTILLARLLYEMIKTNVVKKAKDEDKIESVNSEEIIKLQNQASKLLKDVA